MTARRSITYGATTFAILACAVSGGGCAEATEDATKSGQTVDKSAAKVLAYPDGFRNVATKCDGFGHRVYSNSTGDSGTSSELYVIDDPKCGGSQ